MGLATDSPWQVIVSAALIGTERQPFKSPIATGKLGQVLAQLGDKPTEAALLSTAATLALYQQAGWLPETRSAPLIEPCPSSDLTRCSPRAARFLQQMLQGEYTQFLPEWLALAAIARHRVPEIYLPELLDLGRQQQDLRCAILPALGQRGRWLAVQNPEWSYAVELATEEDWETGSQAARLLYLLQLRFQNPERARELLMASWKQETAEFRAKFIETIRTGLTISDEPFLEVALGDRSKEVRKIAADLLAVLPESRLCQYMIEHIQNYLTLLSGKPPSLHVQLPTALDTTSIKYGIEPKPPASMGEKAWWLLQMLGATPLTFWSKIWGMTPKKIIKLAQNHEWEAVLIDGWALAAKRQKNSAWVEALLGIWINGNQASRKGALAKANLQDLLSILSSEQYNTFVLNFLQSGSGAINESLTIWLLCHSPNQWSTDLAKVILTCLEKHLTRSTFIASSDWELRNALKEFARFIPITLIPEVMSLRTRLPTESTGIQSVEKLLSVLQFRQDLYQAFGA